MSLWGDWEHSSAQRTKAARRERLRRLDGAIAAEWPVRDMTWSSAIDMKGLENRFVAVVDMAALETDRDIDRLYVAMSRPRTGLWVAVPGQLSGRVEELFALHAQEAVGALGKGDR